MWERALQKSRIRGVNSTLASNPYVLTKHVHSSKSTVVGGVINMDKLLRIRYTCQRTAKTLFDKPLRVKEGDKQEHVTIQKPSIEPLCASLTLTRQRSLIQREDSEAYPPWTWT